MRNYIYDHIHLRSPDPDATARFFETMFQAEVTRGVYPPGTLYPGQMRITMKVGGQKVLIAPTHPHDPTAGAPGSHTTAWNTSASRWMTSMPPARSCAPKAPMSRSVL